MKKKIVFMMLCCNILSMCAIHAGATAIQEQLLYDENDIRITATGLDMDDSSYEVKIKLLIENNSSENIIVQTNDSSINGCMIRMSMSADVAAGKKINDTLDIYRKYLDISGIEDFSNIEVSFHVANDSFETLFDTPIEEIKTDLVDYTQTYDDSGNIIYDEEGIKIVSKGISKNESGNASLNLYIENNTDQYIGVQADDTSVNGFMLNPMFSSTIFPQEIIFDDMEFWSDDIEENNIEDIEEIETVFHFFNPDNFQTIFDTEPIAIKF